MTGTDWDHITKISNAVQQAFNAYTPQIWSVMQNVVRIDALGTLITFIVFLILGILAIVFAFKHVFGEDVADGYGNVNNVGTFIVSLLGCGFGTLSTLISFSQLLNIWLWVGVFDPKLSIAHDIIIKVLSKI